MSSQTRVSEDTDFLRLGNQFLEVSFSKQDGGLCAIRNLTTGFDFIVAPQPAAIWRLQLKDRAGDMRELDPTDASRFSWSLKEKERGATIILSWRVRLSRKNLKVQAAIFLSGDSPLSFWEMKIKNPSADYGIWQLTFPVVAGLGPLSNDRSQDYLCLPHQLGALVQDPIGTICQNTEAQHLCLPDSEGKTIVGYQYEEDYPCLYTMQFLSYYNLETGGLYLAAHDGDAYFKSFGIHGAKDSDYFQYQLHNYPEGMGQVAKDYRVPYQAVVGVFQGDWRAAAEIYRAWATQQAWCGKGPLEKRKDLPQWLKDVGIFYWNYPHVKRGTSDQIVEPAIDFQKRMEVPVAIHWYGWQEPPYDTCYPDPFPAREGDEGLKQAIQELHQAGIRCFPYTNGRLWDTASESWKREKPAKWACKNEDLELYIERWGGAEAPPAPLTPICPAAIVGHDKRIQVYEKIVNDYGYDGAYVDQIGSYKAVLCFDPRHGHAIGGGNYWYLGNREMMLKIQKKLKGQQPDAIFTTESCCECFLECFDAFLTLDSGHFKYQFGEKSVPIPLFDAVYHQFGMNYGNSVQLREGYSDQFAYLHGRIFTWGVKLALPGYFAEDIGKPEWEDDLKLLRHLAHTYQQAKKYLLYGEWLIAPELDAPTVEITFSRREKDPEVVREVPAILGSLWRASDGSLGWVLVNHTRQEATARCNFDGTTYGLAEGGCVISQITEDGISELRREASASFQLQETLPPHTAKTLVIARNA